MCLICGKTRFHEFEHFSQKIRKNFFRNVNKLASSKHLEPSNELQDSIVAELCQLNKKLSPVRTYVGDACTPNVDPPQNRYKICFSGQGQL